jgi:hypothetical protein
MSHTPHPAHVRSLISANVRRAMADPAVRQLVSERTKVGMAQRKARIAAEVQLLRELWSSSSATARRQFFGELLSSDLAPSEQADGGTR